MSDRDVLDARDNLVARALLWQADRIHGDLHPDDAHLDASAEMAQEMLDKAVTAYARARETTASPSDVNLSRIEAVIVSALEDAIRYIPGRSAPMAIEVRVESVMAVVRREIAGGAS